MAEMTDAEMAAYYGRRLATVEAALTALTEEADALRQAKAAADVLARLDRGVAPSHEAVTPATAPPATDEAGAGDTLEPRGKEAVRMILMETGKAMNAAMVAGLAVERGWIEDSGRVEDATRTNLGRAYETYADVKRVGRGWYQYEDPDSSILDFNRADFDADAYLASISGSLRDPDPDPREAS